MLRVWLYTIFSNEAQLLPFFLRHYAPACDRLIFYDCGSTDNSRALIEAVPNAVVLPYSDFPVMDSVSAARFASEAYHAARGLADFVIWVDCDEFLWPGSVFLRETLRSYQRQGIRAIKAQGYQMLSDSFPNGDASITDQVRLGIRDSEYDKTCIFDPNLSLRWRPGRHVCTIEGQSAIHQGGMLLLHYRFLGLDFFQRRNAYNDAHRSPAERQANRSYHVASNHQGKYSYDWYANAMSDAIDVMKLEGV